MLACQWTHITAQSLFKSKGEASLSTDITIYQKCMENVIQKGAIGTKNEKFQHDADMVTPAHVTIKRGQITGRKQEVCREYRLLTIASFSLQAPTSSMDTRSVTTKAEIIKSSVSS